ncbi:CDP-diacylglycerol--glycerol-3-phosphate 3-phosphatidyltransferase [Schumannella sp. 10F1B-5-1]|uniref:CDP-diacylglycerol--glycerol-3-phosphate 3-phosphatidyltransferase n=1 Tax=Schumannella sp. 10F1B-5-1 TaxID=2590780 RepID=UPI001130A20A|nr:CDP-diacylglycerol--glycerol-3-phosphate 3-phosphatidyltransferase [Schumannella sp. 10F1B-5-1]TPW70322.1 CDP-diacylglycerol--glycerol-3-phosphate 3-phosphatidyltransferase [Schumannella sp. 10F1B-5-1]
MRGRVASHGDTQASLGNVANIVTVVRILLAPVFIWLLLADGGDDGVLRWVAAALFLVAILTDSVDGFLARRQNLVTDFGKLVDPIADKILVGGALVGLSILLELPWWVTIVILVREFGITVFRFIALRDRVIAASIWGKIKTVVQAVAVSFALVPLWSLLGDWMHWVNTGLMTLAVLLTVGSGIEYLVEAARVGRAAKPAGPASTGDAASGADAGTEPRA